MYTQIERDSELWRSYQSIDTPFLYVDKTKFCSNLDRLRNKVEAQGVKLRPHFKTVRSLKAAKYLLPSLSSPVTVSTVKEAESLASEGYTDIVYAVGIAKEKLIRIHKLQSAGVEIKVLLDSVEQAEALNRFCQQHNQSIGAVIEIDCDGHRGGVKPSDPKLIEIAQILCDGAARFLGVLAHAGESYGCFDTLSLTQSASNEVSAVLSAAKALGSVGIECEITSIGSTPTAHHYQNLAGITEVRAGVYAFFDLVMTGIGICSRQDIAASVVTTVIGHSREQGRIFIDAGWMALSSDRGTANQPNDCGYGLVTFCNGEIIEGAQVKVVNQEHGIVEAVSGAELDFNALPIGCRLHILPNHACSTASMHAQYHVFDIAENSYEVWPRVQGW